MIQHQTRTPAPQCYHVTFANCGSTGEQAAGVWGDGSELSHLHQGATEIYHGSEAVLVALVPSGTNWNLGSMQKRAEHSKTFKARSSSTEGLLLTFDLLKRTPVDITCQIIISESLAAPAADVPASIPPATVMLASRGVQTLLSALPTQRSTPTARIMSHGGASLI